MLEPVRNVPFLTVTKHRMFNLHTVKGYLMNFFENFPLKSFIDDSLNTYIYYSHDKETLPQAYGFISV